MLIASWYLLFRLAGELEITSKDNDGKPFDLETCMVAGKAKAMLLMEKGETDVSFMCTIEYPPPNVPMEDLWAPTKRPL